MTLKKERLLWRRSLLYYPVLEKGRNSLQPKGTEDIWDVVLCILGAQHEHVGVGK